VTWREGLPCLFLSLSLGFSGHEHIALSRSRGRAGGGEVTGPADDGAAVAFGRIHAGRWFPGTDGYGMGVGFWRLVRSGAKRWAWSLRSGSSNARMQPRQTARME
jgi:hypothetical protein